MAWETGGGWLAKKTTQENAASNLGGPWDGQRATEKGRDCQSTWRARVEVAVCGQNSGTVEVSGGGAGTMPGLEPHQGAVQWPFVSREAH